MKIRPSSGVVFWKKIKDALAGSDWRRSFNEAVDGGLVKLRIVPERMDGAGKVLHVSDTPTGMYGYLARVLRRVNPSVVIHTGDLADDIKLEMYPAEAGRYKTAAARLINILTAPHRTTVIALGNHDDAALLPELPPSCVVCGEPVFEAEFFGERFRASHYFERVEDGGARYNLFGHSPEPESRAGDDGGYFFNGVEAIRLIDPPTGETNLIFYPWSVNRARYLRRGRT
jgi:hypothetical protein